MSWRRNAIVLTAKGEQVAEQIRRYNAGDPARDEDEAAVFAAWRESDRQGLAALEQAEHRATVRRARTGRRLEAG
ncbi:MAG: hypothetical protein ACRDNZ_24005 [Streptosporangiaceae bacterium]